MSWKTTAALLLGLAAQGCGIITDTSRREFERQVDQYMARTADRMAQQAELRDMAYERTFERQPFFSEKDYEHAAKRVYKNVGHSALKAAWRTITDDTSLDGIIEPSFADSEGNRFASTNELFIPPEKLKSTSYRLGFTPVVRLGETQGGGIKTKEGHLLLLRGKDRWEIKGGMRVEGFHLGGEYHDNDLIKDSYRFYIQKDSFSFSYEKESEDKMFLIEFVK